MNKKRRLYFALLVLFCGIVTSNCDYYKDYGRGYRYEHGGNYFGSDPSFSPDGTKIVFGSIRNGVGDIFTINIDGSNLIRLTDTEAYEGEPKFSPDGNKIVFISERNSANYGKIFIMNADGSNQTQVTSGNFYDYAPFISNDASQIVFIRDKENYHSDIYSINIDGTNLKRLTTDETSKSILSQTKNGKKIQYSSFNLKTQEVNIYEMNFDGTGRKLILTLPKGGGAATFSPDGKKVVFILTRMTDYAKDFYTKTEVFIMNSDGTNQRQLTKTETYKGHPTFSPDGRKIMFLSLEKDGKGKGQIIIMNIDGSELKTITNNY